MVRLVESPPTGPPTSVPKPTQGQKAVLHPAL
jgi:hypothetical protein